jgi:iron(II)-dependent oxidoreductase
MIRGEDGAEMVLVPAGEFRMGSQEFEEERPEHRVFLDAFYIDKYEVTNTLYLRFVGAAGRSAPTFWQSRWGTGPDEPVLGVTWSDAEAYCQWAGKRLPTEAEWEKAARGTDGQAYPWGDQWDPGGANFYGAELGRTVAVGSYPRGVSPYGVHDMAGNVSEWVSDWYDKNYYRRSPAQNPRGPDSGEVKVVRGGSQRDSPIGLRSARRSHFAPDTRFDRIGFRCTKPSRTGRVSIATGVIATVLLTKADEGVSGLRVGPSR